MKALARDGWVLAERAVRLVLRNPQSLISAVAAPLVFLALFNIVLREIMTARGFDYEQLLPSTVVVQAMLFTGMSAAYYMAGDRLGGIVGRFRSMPVHRGAPVVGRALADGLRGLVSALVVVGVGVVAGMRFDAGVAGFVGYVLLAVLFAITMSLGMGLLGYVASTPQAAASMASLPYLPLIMLSTGFAPAEDFPGWLKPFVAWQPISATIDALRALAGDGDIASTVARSVAWCVGLSALFVALNVRALGRSS